MFLYYKKFYYYNILKCFFVSLNNRKIIDMCFRRGKISFIKYVIKMLIISFSHSQTDTTLYTFWIDTGPAFRHNRLIIAY